MSDAQENKYHHEQNMQFKVQVRASRLFGLWAGEIMGFTGAEIESYAAQVVDADFEEPGFEDVIRKVKKDFKKSGARVDEKQMRRVLDEKITTAKHMVMDEEKLK